MIIGPLTEQGLQVDFTQLAKTLGYTSSGFRDRVFNAGWKSAWVEAKRIAHERALNAGAYARDRTLTPPEAVVTDEDLVQAAKTVLL